MDLGSVTCEIFSAHVGDRFQVQLNESGWATFELLSATQHKCLGNRSGARVPFCLTFRGPKTPIFPQKIYRFEHEVLGIFDVFAVPVGPDQLGIQYDVQFS